MNLKNIFKKLVLLDLLLIILLISTLFFENEMIASFNEHVDQTTDMFSLVALIWLVIWLVSLYFLYKFKKNGKQLYFFTFVFAIILSLLMGASAQSSISYVLDALSWANSGAILTLLYFSPIKKEFDK
tara:strand:- start:157 stop:540 length:384 start_codon:yes stop_codon:yes gene_type:complete